MAVPEPPAPWRAAAAVFRESPPPPSRVPSDKFRVHCVRGSQAAEKMDSLMELTLGHIERRCNAGQLEAVWHTLQAGGPLPLPPIPTSCLPPAPLSFTPVAHKVPSHLRCFYHLGRQPPPPPTYPKLPEMYSRCALPAPLC